MMTPAQLAALRPLYTRHNAAISAARRAYHQRLAILEAPDAPEVRGCPQCGTPLGPRRRLCDPCRARNRAETLRASAQRRRAS